MEKNKRQRKVLHPPTIPPKPSVHARQLEEQYPNHMPYIREFSVRRNSQFSGLLPALLRSPQLPAVRNDE